MIILFLIHAFSDICSVEYADEQLPKGYKLIHSTIVFKHGLRAPIDKIPGQEIQWNCSGNDWIYPGGNPLNDELKFVHQFQIKPISHQSFLHGTCRAGDLLEDGVKQMKRLSSFIKNSYSSILTSSFQKRSFSFRSTYTNRCLACIQNIVQGLYDGNEPVDVFVSNEELETLVPNGFICPALQNIFENTLSNHSAFYKVLNEYDSQLNEIKRLNNITAVPHWLRLGEYLVTRKCANTPTPKGFDDKIMNISMNALIKFYEEVLSTENGRKFGTGLLLSEIYYGMRDFLSGGSDSKFVLVCGHSLTFVSLLSSLQIEVTWPQYGSFLSFDLLEKGYEYIVRITQNGHEIKSFQLNEFEQYINLNRPTEKECNVIYPFQEKDKKSLAITLLQMAFS